MLRPLDLVELVIRHAGFRVRLCDGKRAIGATPAAASGYPPTRGSSAALIEAFARK